MQIENRNIVNPWRKQDRLYLYERGDDLQVVQQ